MRPTWRWYLPTVERRSSARDRRDASLAVSTAKGPGAGGGGFFEEGDFLGACGALNNACSPNNAFSPKFFDKKIFHKTHGKARRLSRFVLGSTIMKHPASDALQDHRHGFAFPFRRDRPNGSVAPYRRPARHAPPLKLATGTRRPRAVSRSRRRRARQTPRAPG